MKTNRLKRTLSALISVIMVFTFVPCFTSANAAEEVVIHSANELIELAYSQDRADFAKDYRLANDIDMSDTDDERPLKAIGSYSNGSDDIPFNGTFDGDGHKITNLATTGEALFGYIGDTGVIKDVTLENASVYYSQNDSSKYPASLVSLNYGQIQNCFSVNSVVVSQYCSPVGGLIGTNFGNVSRCGVLGGSVSFAANTSGTSHGGFVGNQRGGTIEECFSTASVEAKKWAGGFAGKIENGIISDCYALGNVTGSEENGGFAGAFMQDAVLRNVYAVNDVTATSGGGLAGGKGFSFAEAGVPENCYYCSESLLPQNSGTFQNSSACAKSSDEMRSAEFAAMLSDKWAYSENINNGYPYLINAMPPVSDNTENITAKIMLAGYDKDSYEFYKISEPFEVSITKNTVTVKDIMDAAVNSGDLTYSFGTNGQSGQIITINDITAQSPDGWLFTINGTIASVGASSAIISDGDTILWYVGTPENGYNEPDWDSIGTSPDDFTFINNSDDLLNLMNTPDMWSKNYRLSADINLSGIEFSPIGNSETPFSGSFDGNGFEIENLTITGDKNTQNIGMFGVIKGARLDNITLKNVNITGGSVVGGLVGRAESEENNISFISDCNVSGNVTATGNSYIKQTDAGGFIGVNDSAVNELSGNVFLSAIDNCTSDVTVTADIGTADISDAGHIGGFAGLNKGTISNSSAKGNVKGGNTTGGFVGSNYGGNIYSSSSQGKVEGAYTTGGFAGVSGINSLIENCYSTGDVAALGENGANYGGFAGSLSGKVKNCISSGTLTKGYSYNGGFAGTFDGTIWSYNDDLRSISGCYGNIISNGGEKIKALGNYIGGVHAPTDIAAEEIGVDKETAEKKIEEMLNNSMAASKLKMEAVKYKANAAIPSTVQENSDITSLVARLNENTSADSEITLSYKSENNVIKANSLGYTLESKPENDTKETVTLSLSMDGIEYEQPITVTLYAADKNVDKDNLLKNIVGEYSENTSDYWKISAVSAYNKLFGGVKMSDKAKSDFVSGAVKTISETDGDTTLAMNIIALRSLGYSAEDITAEDGSKINAVEKLADAPSTGNNGDAYRLLAYSVCGYDNQSDIDAVINRLLSSQINEQGWSNSHNDGIDADTTGAVLLGLSPYYSENPKAKIAADSAVEYLSSLMQTDGNIKSSYKESNYGTNANTSAICAIGLEALGIDINSDERFKNNSVSLFDGIMSFASEDETGFVYEHSDLVINDLATKQAVIAVMAAEKNGNIFDFSDMPKNSINLQKSSDSSNGSKGGKGSSGNTAVKTIDVYLTLIGDTAHGKGNHTEFTEWISEMKVEAAENASAREVIEKALSGNGYSVKGLESGYISEITTPDGLTLGEYTNGEQSGWMYSVNDESPTVGINDYTVKNGDKIKVYYADSWSDSSFPDVKSDDWFFDAAQFASQNNLIQGNEKGEFMPDTALTRAMAVTILCRYKGDSQGAYNDSGFSDVSKSDWFEPSVNWAAANGIVSGLGNGLFAPNDSITREQLALILYNLTNPDENTEDYEIEGFSDTDNISDWAYDAMNWAVKTQLISGMDDGTLAPQSTATRAQFAMILMRLNDLIK